MYDDDLWVMNPKITPEGKVRSGQESARVMYMGMVPAGL